MVDELQMKVSLILDELSKQIISLAGQDKLADALFFLDQYVKLAPTSVERYSLEALVREREGDLSAAEVILQEGFAQHPRSFDLFYNLGYIHEKKKDILNAYHIYMRARYISETKSEKEDIAAAVKRLTPLIVGSTKSQKDSISNILKVGEKTITITAKKDHLFKRKRLLGHIEKHIDKFAGSVLEIGFIDGVISKNLNYYGYDVTAVDRRKSRILNVIASEWHDNVLQAQQEVAKFYHEPVLDLDWMRKIPEFEVIIVVGDQNLDTFEADAGQGKELLDLLLQKASKQLFIRVVGDDAGLHSDPPVKEFIADDLTRVAASHHLVPEVIATEKDDDGREFQLCLVTKPPEPQYFSVPVGVEAEHSRSTILEVEMAKCVDSYGAAYVGDWQPFVQAVKQYREDPDL